ncbi:RusA family crossover junction endodeoxyribonuclease [Pediococcus pentosaceus]|uniref:RusA family crossover junction endodeoxyribonuclease n=1 Tax=Pediococcus pentosaceus TaxID=1255 RepID=UPI00105248D0|nr:RusA family crossover junction endodeoxyribonuclease [Pediococcus pentosaceus]
MFKISWEGKPQPAERARPRFSRNKDSYYMYNPPSYQMYQRSLINFFSKFSEDPDLKALFDKKQLIYGLSIKIIFKIQSKGKNPFYGKRPDSDNLYKAVVDALFASKVNQLEDGYLTDKEGNYVFDSKGNPLIKYKQKVDDSRVIHHEVLKLRVDEFQEQGFIVVIRNVGKDDIS